MVTKTQILSVVKTPEFVAGVGAFTAFFAGGATSAVLLKKNLEAKYALLAEQEIAEAKRYYASLYKAEEFSDPEELAKARGYIDPELEQAEEMIRDLAYKPSEQMVREILDHAAERQAEDDENDIGAPTVVVNVFEQNKPEVPENRDTSRPFVVSLDEFYENEPEHTQHTVTYYEGDEVLADERDQVIEDITLVGKANLTFGYLSNDPNVVYVRNNQKKMDFEIAKSEGKYAHEVLGFEHSDEPFDRRRRVRRFRGDDE